MNPLQPLVSWLVSVFAIVKTWVAPLLTIIIPLAVPIGVIVEAFRNPTGWTNQVMINIIDMVAGVFPNHPPSLTITGLISQAGVEGFGGYVISEILSTIGIIIGVDIVIKIWKLLPFT